MPIAVVLMRAEGIEPSAKSLKGSCSTTELRPLTALRGIVYPRELNRGNMFSKLFVPPKITANCAGHLSGVTANRQPRHLFKGLNQRVVSVAAKPLLLEGAVHIEDHTG